MAKQKQFDDPLEDVDPVMESAFSSYTKQETPAARVAPEKAEKAEKPQKAAPRQPVLETFEEDSDLPDISDIQFPTLTNEHAGKRVEMDLFGNIPINLSVELGRSQISLKEVFELSEGSIIELERLVGEPLDLVVNGQVIAQGEVVAIDNNYGLRVTNVLTPPATN